MRTVIFVILLTVTGLTVGTAQASELKAPALEPQTWLREILNAVEATFMGLAGSPASATAPPDQLNDFPESPLFPPFIEPTGFESPGESPGPAEFPPFIEPTGFAAQDLEGQKGSSKTIN